MKKKEFKLKELSSDPNYKLFFRIRIKNISQHMNDKIYKLISVQHPLKKMKFQFMFSFDDGYDTGTNLRITFDIQTILKIQLSSEFK